MNDILASGRSLGSATGVTGPLRTIRQPKDVDTVKEGDLVYIPKDVLGSEDVLLFYDLVKTGVAGILCEEIGRTNHGIVLVNEFGIPCLGDIDSNIINYEGKTLTIHDNKVVNEFEGVSESNTIDFDSFPDIDIPIRINLGFPEIVDTRQRLIDHVDGVGFMRVEFVLLDVLDGVHPTEYIRQYGKDEFIENLSTRIEPVVSAFEEDPVWIRTNDFSVSQLYRMEGGEMHETLEENPMLGWRGIARSIDEEILLEIEFEALRRLSDSGYDNIGVFPPMTRFPDEFREWKAIANEVGLEKVNFGIMVETPAAALTFENFVHETDFMVFGSNDLTQFTLAIDRGNTKLQSKYDEKEPAVQKLMERVIQICNRNNIESSIGGQAASDPELMTKLLNFGIDGFSVSPNPETIRAVKKHIYSRQ